MIYLLSLAVFALADYCVADVSELLESGNGFMYDAPPNTYLTWAPLDGNIDKITKLAFSGSTGELSSYECDTEEYDIEEYDIVPLVATAVILNKELLRRKRIFLGRTTYEDYSSYFMPYIRDRRVSNPERDKQHYGYDYTPPVKPFFIA